VLKARKAMRDVPLGGVLRVVATDPGAVKDFEHFCKTTGYRLLAQREEAGKLIFDIERTG
jgi:tRNA 2-thiouridine synthesizing protein A